MPFETTEKYKDRLETIRTEPQETAEEKEIKREHAREFRMEVMLDNARIVRDLITRLEHIPECSKKDLMEMTGLNSEYMAHPEAVEKFIDELKASKRKVLSSIEKIESLAGKKSAYIAEVFYRQLMKEGSATYAIKGKITLDTSYPLAIILYIENSDDFNKIDARKNIGGFYEASANLPINYPAKFPLIAIKGDPKSGPLSDTAWIEKHEKGHAEHSRFIESLREGEQKTVWLNPETPDRKTIADLEYLWQFSEETLRSKKSELKEWNNVMDYALEKAKDELLSETRAFGFMQHYLQYLKNRGGVYDYFKEIGIKPDSELYNDLWTAYIEKLELAINSAGSVLQSYRKMGLHGRGWLMRWVLAQIPLRDWADQLDKSAFAQESKELDKIFMLGLSSLNMNRQFKLAYNELIIGLKNDERHSFLPQIKQFYARLKSSGINLDSY